MNRLLAYKIDEVLNPQTLGLGCESHLRVAAATLSRTRSQLVTATTVVGILGQDDIPAVEALVAEIADEFGLESRLHTNVGSFSVRFSRMEES